MRVVDALAAVAAVIYGSHVVLYYSQASLTELVLHQFSGGYRIPASLTCMLVESGVIDLTARAYYPGDSILAASVSAYSRELGRGRQAGLIVGTLDTVIAQGIRAGESPNDLNLSGGASPEYALTILQSAAFMADGWAVGMLMLYGGDPTLPVNRPEIEPGAPMNILEYLLAEPIPQGRAPRVNTNRDAVVAQLEQYINEGWINLAPPNPESLRQRIRDCLLFSG